MKKVFTLALVIALLVNKGLISQELSPKFDSISSLSLPLLSISNTVKPFQQPNVNFRIVCLKSVQADPLWVIDGIVYESSEVRKIKLEVDDIENITILKNTDVIALYGCKAIGGVIIVTTKQSKIREFIVKDFLDGSSIAGVTVFFISTNKKDTLMELTNDSGLVAINKLKAGAEYEMKISCVGYKTLTVPFLNNYNYIKKIFLLERDQKNCLEVVVTSQQARTIRCGGCCYCIVCKSGNTFQGELINNNAFQFYPNPIKSGSTLNIEWRKNETGNYKLEFFNLSGQLIFSKEMRIDEEAKLLNIQIPQVAAGNYFLRMTNKTSGKNYTEKIVVKH